MSQEEALCSTEAATALTTGLKEAVSNILTREDFNLPSVPCNKLQAFGKRLLVRMEPVENSIAVACFVVKLFKVFDIVLHEASKAKLCHEQRKKAWSKFHSLRCGEIKELWKSLLTTLEISDTHSLLLQSVTQNLFEAKLKEMFPSKDRTATNITDKITENEKNVIMYTCGYIPVSLIINRYEKREDLKSPVFVQCLLTMAIGGSFEDSFYDYAKKWFEITNRGGALEVKDCVFEFFLVVEVNTRTYLRALFTQTEKNRKTAILQELAHNEDILFHWSIVSVDIDDNEIAQELLIEVLKLWVTIRGFSVAGMWNEQYKRICNEMTKGKSGLRKGLKQ